MQNDDGEKLFLEATQKYEGGDYKAAFDLFSQLAEQGEAWAMNYLGIMYGAGEGVDKDDKKSLQYHKRAGRKSKWTGDYCNIARQYEIMENRRRALYWWNKAVAHGDKSAALRLAKYLLINQRSNSRKRAIGLIRVTAAAHAPLEVSEDDIEEAQELLNTLRKAPAATL